MSERHGQLPKRLRRRPKKETKPRDPERKRRLQKLRVKEIDYETEDSD